MLVTTKVEICHKITKNYVHKYKGGAVNRLEMHCLTVDVKGQQNNVKFVYCAGWKSIEFTLFLAPPVFTSKK